MTLRVGVFPHADVPHIIPCFRICRQLLNWGYEVQVLGSDVEVIDRGHSEAWRGLLAGYGLSGLQVIRSSRDLSFSDWLTQQLITLKLDVLILDAIWQGLAFAFHGSDLVRNVVVHHAGLPDFRSSDMPTWAFVHPGHPKDHWAQARRTAEQFERSGSGVRAVVSSIKALASTGTTTGHDFDFGCGEFKALPAVRAMSLCPAVEFPAERGRIDYFGTLLPEPGDVDWKSPPSELMDESQTLITCMFGTTGLQTKEEYQWLATLAEILARAFPNGQVLVVIPDWASSQWPTDDRPKNLVSRPWIPLWELLSTRRGPKVLVTTPGIGALREAIASGTPVVAIPRRVDQFGAAARVEYFNLGSCLVSHGLPNPELVVERVAKVLADPDIQIQAQRLRQECIAFDATKPLKRFIENPIRGGSLTP